MQGPEHERICAVLLILNIEINNENMSTYLLSLPILLYQRVEGVPRFSG